MANNIPTLTEKGAKYLMSAVGEYERLKTLTDKQLVLECLHSDSDAADYPIVEEMMSRLYPDWVRED